MFTLAMRCRQQLGNIGMPTSGIRELHGNRRQNIMPAAQCSDMRYRSDESNRANGRHTDRQIDCRPVQK
jgi:hypothetical protein